MFTVHFLGKTYNFECNYLEEDFHCVSSRNVRAGETAFEGICIGHVC